MNQLLCWLEKPSSGAGLKFLQDAGGWEFFSFEDLAARSFQLGGAIQACGIERGAVICVFLPTGPEFVSAMFGTWMAGATLCPLVPPMMFEDELLYLEHVSRIVRSAKPSAVLTDGTHARLVAQVLQAAGVAESVVLDVGEVPRERSVRPTTVADVALLQFTSGSSGAPRGVRVGFDNLISNIEAIRTWIRMGSGEATATWLPLYHDMGLIGCLLTPTVNQSDVWIMRPDQFVRDPLEWLRCFGERGASLCAAPNFGYGYAARKTEGTALEGMDFSNWRVAIAGAEPVDAHALTHLANCLEPFGFSKKAYLPAYGLAEATLAVTGGSPTTQAQAVNVDWDRLVFGERVPIRAVAKLEDLQEDKSLGWLVGSGAPHAGTTVKVVDDEGQELPVGHLGEIIIRGPSVTLGYADHRPEGTTRFTANGLITGDAGFFVNDELFVVGRIADSIKVRGRSIYADDLEARLATTTGIRRGRFVVIVTPGEITGAVLAIGEDADAQWAERAARVLKGILGQDVPIRVGIGPRGTIRRTSSGKPRRRVMWKLEQSGGLQLEETVEL